MHAHMTVVHVCTNSYTCTPPLRYSPASHSLEHPPPPLPSSDLNTSQRIPLPPPHRFFSFFPLPTHFPSDPQLRVWIASIAFSLVFGTVFVKTWRVYYIFYSTNRHRRNKKLVSHVVNVYVGGVWVWVSVSVWECGCGGVCRCGCVIYFP